MSRYDQGIVASGHREVSKAAAEILRSGGNAFDAVVAAGFASAVTEPALNSLGGGGFLVGHSEKHGQALFFDFFVNTPGLGRRRLPAEPDFFPITVTFSGSTQDFNVGHGSVAVPGTLKGLLRIQERLGRMGLEQVLEPARELAREHRVNPQQAHFLELLYPIMTLHPVGRSLYEPGGVYLQAGDLLRNPAGAAFLDELAVDRGERFYLGEVAARIDQEMRDRGGLLTREDLAAYRVVERPPLTVPYRGHRLFTCPEPSLGGTLIGLSLSLAAGTDGELPDWGSGEHLIRVCRLMQEVERCRAKGVTTPADLEAFLESGGDRVGSAAPGRCFSRGTTHISVADQDGNCAAMTCSNGEGSGYFAPDTGVMLNNMMGEDDLHPEGFHASPPGIRVGSMMSPSLLVNDGAVRLVIGSGGSKRIRTAVTQVLSQVVDYRRSLQEAVASPRLYWDGQTVQVEPGFSAEALESLAREVPVNLWTECDVYFGGVHAVIPGSGGAGDPRRGGAVEMVAREPGGDPERPPAAGE